MAKKMRRPAPAATASAATSAIVSVVKAVAMVAVVVAMVAVANAAKVPMVKFVPRVKAVAVAKAEVNPEVKDALKGVRGATNCATARSAPPVIVPHARAVAKVATTTAMTRTKVVQKPKPS